MLALHCKDTTSTGSETHPLRAEAVLFPASELLELTVLLELLELLDDDEDEGVQVLLLLVLLLLLLDHVVEGVQVLLDGGGVQVLDGLAGGVQVELGGVYCELGGVYFGVYVVEGGGGGGGGGVYCWPEP